MTERNFGNVVRTWTGLVSNVNDPQRSGRVQVRVYGLHDDTTNIPDEDLPWAQVIQPPTSAARGRIGTAPVGLVVGSRAFGIWLDSDQQYPILLGSFGRAGQIIPGQTAGGAPAVNTALGSIPPGSIGNPNNPYSELNPSRITITDVDGRVVDVDGVPDSEGIVLTESVEENMSFAKLPTTAGGDPNERDVLSLLRSVDPGSLLSSLPCLQSNALELSIQIDLGSIASNLINSVSNAVTEALLNIVNSLGIDQVLNAIEQAASGIRNFRDALNALQEGGLCGAPRALASIDSGTQAIARSFSSLREARDRFGNSPTQIRNALGIAQDRFISNIPSDVFRPISEVLRPPENYVQEYYPANEDPFPGYIRWYDPNDLNAERVFTLRNGQPNFRSAEEHVRFDTENLARTLISNAISNRTLTSGSLNAIMSQVSDFAALQGQIRTLGNGFNISSIASIAAIGLRLAPRVIGTVRGIFEGRISISVLTNVNVVQTATRNFSRVQTNLAMRRARLETALRRI